MGAPAFHRVMVFYFKIRATDSVALSIHTAEWAAVRYWKVSSCGFFRAYVQLYGGQMLECLKHT